MVNENIIWGKWKELKGEIKTQWGNLTDDELEKSSGNMDSISGLIQQKYGHKREEIEEKLKLIAAAFTKKTEEIKNHLK